MNCWCNTVIHSLGQDKKGVKLEDGKLMGGRTGRLTKTVIDSFQVYYGKAIRDNIETVHDMRRAIWAIYHHKLSTDAKPAHELCPDDPNTWCLYNKAKLTGDSYNHKHKIDPAVMAEVKPVFQFLSHPDLLKKCLHGKTQNANESFNGVVWSKCSKRVFVGPLVVGICLHDAVLTYNDGCCSRLAVIEVLTGRIGKMCVLSEDVSLSTKQKKRMQCLK